MQIRAIFAAIYFLLASPALAQRPVISAPDPYTITPIASSTQDYTNPNGKTLVSSVPSSPSTTAVIITAGQSLMASEALGTYTTVNAGALNFSHYDGGTYHCDNPVLGVQAVFTNSPNCLIADSLITNGVYTSVIMVPMAEGATLCSDLAPGGQYSYHIGVVGARLAAAHLTKATGFAGDVWILLHQGESDNLAGTGQAALTACYQSLAGAYVSAGFGTTRFFIPQAETIINNATSATVAAAQAAALSGCSTCRVGANWDSLTGGTNRQGDGTHLTQAGNAAAAALDVAIITNCKNTAC